jgi:hypothetical protein
MIQRMPITNCPSQINGIGRFVSCIKCRIKVWLPPLTIRRFFCTSSLEQQSKIDVMQFRTVRKAMYRMVRRAANRRGNSRAGSLAIGSERPEAIILE